MTSQYDIIIIGGGPAGLSAASSIVRQDHKTLLFDSKKYHNGPSKHMHTLPSWDHKDPEDFRAASREDLVRYGSVTVENAEVVSLKQRGDGLFEAVTGEARDGSGKRTWLGKKIILATGVEAVFPDIPGYADCWVSGIFHCMYCHGWEERGVNTAGMLAEGATDTVLFALHFARQVLRVAKHVTLYTNGNEKLAEDLTDALKAASAPMTVNSEKIIKLVKAPERASIKIELANGDTITEGFLAHNPNTKLRGDLAEQLGLEITKTKTSSVISVKPPFNQTSLKGVFAAGDCASPMHTVTGALHSGTCAGGGAPLQIQAELYHQPAIF